MSDRWSPGESLSAAKLNRNSASTNSAISTGPGGFSKVGSSFGSTSPDTAPETFWVAIDEAKGVNADIGSNRVIYRHSWTMVTYDPARGAWRRCTGIGGNWAVDPVYNYDPLQKIPETGPGNTIGSSPEKFVTTVYPVTRDPRTGILFFFS